MSNKSKREIICPNCAQGQKVTLYTGINNIQNPELKDRILKEDIFDFKCKGCGYKAQLVYPLIFIDSRNSYVIAFCPVQTEEELETDEKISSFTKRKVKNIAELKEKIMIFDNHLNDLAIEMVKNSFVGIFRNKYQNTDIQMYFSHVDTREDLTFAIFVGDEKRAVYEKVNFMVYKQSAEVLRSIAYQEKDEFLRVDTATVKILTGEK
ncbi:MAG: CpXC domain-containing protein [Clostridia bacterium]